MTRDEYQTYANAFNQRDYDTVFDFYDENPDISFFGVEIKSRSDLKKFYGFLHQYVRESITVEKFASSDDLAAVEGIIRVEAIADLTPEILAKHGLEQFFPIAKGDVQEMRQYIHYSLKNGKITGVECAIVG